MTPLEIAEKYVYGKHDALTDNQEVIDITKDIEEAIIILKQKDMRSINYKVQGFLKEKERTQMTATTSKNLEGVFRGFRLDEIKLQATIKSQKELDDLILFLQESRPCFL